jgi:exopolysaccharide biosynthesis operon protein EpsL
MHTRSIIRLVVQEGVKPALLLTFACMTISPSHADPEDSLNFAVGTTVRHEDNLFRLPSGSAPPNPGGGKSSSKSDLLSTAYVGIRIDKPYSLQRFQLDVTATQYNYRDNNYLNFAAVDYRGAWLWAASPQVTGVLSADKTSELTSYANLQNTTIRNKRTTENERFLADWLISGGWHLTGGVYRLRSIGENAGSTAIGDFDQKTGELGAKYVSANNNSIAAVHRESRGDYVGRSLDAVNLLDTGYKQRENELRSILQVSGSSLLDMRLGLIDRKFENFSQRNYSGTVGALSYRWTPTGKLRFSLTGGRDLVAYQESSDSYYASNYVSLTPEWLITDKTTARLKLDIAQNNFRGAVVPVTTMRDDQIRSTQIGLNWRPTRTINIDGYLTHEQRSSNLSVFDYRANIAGVAASLLF